MAYALELIIESHEIYIYQNGFRENRAAKGQVDHDCASVKGLQGARSGVLCRNHRVTKQTL